MSTTYKICKNLYSKGKLTATMLDVYYGAGRLSDEEYQELMSLIMEG